MAEAETHDGATASPRLALSGVGWAYFVFVCEKLIVFGTTAVIARVLVPESFGVIATALLVLSLGEALRDLGLKDALIYIGEKDGHADTMFWLNLAFGAAISGFFLLIAPSAARLLASPELTDVLRWMSLAFFVSAFGGAHEALLQHRLLFARRYLVDFLAAVFKGAVTVGLVLAGYGVWAVVYGFLASAVFRTIGRWVALPWRPRAWPRLDAGRSLLRYGSSIVVVSLIDLPLFMADQIAIAAVLGQTALAYYYIAARIPEVALSHFNLVAARVVFPIFVSIKDDRQRLVEHVLETARFTSFAIVPMSLGLAAIADLVIPLLFGAQWLPSVDLLIVLSLVGLAESITWSIGDGLKAMGRPDLLAKLTLLDVVYIPLLVVGGVLLTGEAIGACIGALIGFAISSAIRIWVAKLELGIPQMAFLDCFRSASIAAAVMLVAVVAVKVALGNLGLLAQLVATVGVAVIVYGLMLWWLERARILRALHAVGFGTARRVLQEPSPPPTASMPDLPGDRDWVECRERP